MDITSIPANGSTSSTTQPKRLDFETFLLLLTVQLATQNPLEPMSDRDFFAQMAQLGTVQGMDEMKAASARSEATSLLGRTVTATSANGSTVMGEVVSLSFRNGSPVLSLDVEGGLVDVTLPSVQRVAV